jgi:hypothetical protein
MTPTTAWIFMDMVIELGDVEVARKASILASKWILNELEENFKGFASEDRVKAWEKILNELPNFGNKGEE